MDQNRCPSKGVWIFSAKAKSPKASPNDTKNLNTEPTHGWIRLATKSLLLVNAKSQSCSSQDKTGSLSNTLVTPMRRHSNANSNAAPCKNHRAKDNDDLNEILSLVRHEVTTHFRQLDAYPNLIGPRQTGILAYLRAMQGMWTTPLVGSTVAPGAWLYEISGCAACMLTRICADTDALCYLYVVVKSRTRTRDRDHPRRLMAFIEECMGSHGPNMVSLMNDIMSADAVQMKIVRKACMKAWMLDVRLKGSLPSQRESPSIESRKITADGAAS